MPEDTTAAALDTGPGLDSRVELMTYHGGIIGAFMNDRKKLQAELQRWNGSGYRLAHLLPPKTGLGVALMQIVCMVLTLTLWFPVPGETLIFEKRS